VINANWKLAADNFVGDMYHVPYTHRSTLKLNLRRDFSGDGYQLNPGPGHGVGGEWADRRINAYTGVELQPRTIEFLKKYRDALASQKGDYVIKIVPAGHMTIFPNCSALDTVRFTTIRVWHPRGPEKTEVYSWCLVPKDYPEDLKQEVKKHYTLSFGPGGIFEQDDVIMWEECTKAARGYMARKVYLNYQMGLGSELEAAQVIGPQIRGKAIDSMYGEINNRAFYARWLELMSKE